jgi:hypothetical protein
MYSGHSTQIAAARGNKAEKKAEKQVRLSEFIAGVSQNPGETP